MQIVTATAVPVPLRELSLQADAEQVVADAILTHAEVDIRAALRELAPLADHLPVEPLDGVLHELFAGADEWDLWGLVADAWDRWHHAERAHEPDAADLRAAFGHVVEHVARIGALTEVPQ